MLADINLIPLARPDDPRTIRKLRKKEEDLSKKVVPRRQQANASKRDGSGESPGTLSRYA